VLALVAALLVALPGQIPPIPPIPPVPPIPPIPPIPCLPALDPSCPPLPAPPPTDEPPTLLPLKVVERTATTLLVSWRASDDRGVEHYLVYRDGKFIVATSGEVHHWRFKLLCGRHSYRVEALDAYAQRDSQRLIVRRRC
jgi:hypothetical protein